MLTTTDLMTKYGMSNRQVRHRLTALRQLAGGQMYTGQHGETVIADRAVDLFDRLMELERGGLSVSAAAERIAEDLKGLSSTPKMAVGDLASPDVVPPPDPRLLQALEDQILELKRDKSRLIDELAEARGQIQAMLPAVSEGRQRLGRLEHLRKFLFGG